MEIYPLGHASFRIKGKAVSIVTDPYDPVKVGLRFPKTENIDIVTVSHDHQDHNNISLVQGPETFVINGPGEYEVKGVFVLGIETSHDNKDGELRGKNTIYKMTVDAVKICHLGDLGHKLSNDQVTLLGDIDILFIPVGGVYTIDAKEASEVVAQLEPRIVIPMHYKRLDNPEVTAGKIGPLSNFIKEMGADNVAPQPKLSTSKDKLPETTTVVVLE